MKKIIQFRWAILVVWVLATVLLTIFQPNINSILDQRGQTPLNDNSPSVEASNMLNKMDPVKGNNDIIVFYDKNTLNAEDINQIETAVKSISDSKSALGMNEIIDPFSTPDAKGSLISKDNTTLMVSFKLDKGSRSVDDIVQQINQHLTNVKANHYLTGEDFINNDYMKASVAGVEKSAILTVLFILIILIIMFRSLITPLVSLISVAFTYLCSMGIAAQLIDKAGFPVTTLTQILLLLILFGIGTDYNILLFNRFKEELYKGNSTDEAIINTYKTAGKTIAFSILTVFIAFFSLIFSESPIYKSGVVVTIGAALLILEIITLTPLAMKVLGAKLFWPSKNSKGHKESKLWAKLTTVSTAHPIISVLLVVIIIGSASIFYTQKLNFDTISELGNSCPSAQGFNILADHFGKGQAMPTTIVIENDKPLDNNDSLSVIDSITEKVKALRGVKQVSSVTQPLGNQITDFYIGNQMGSVTDGVSKTQNGINQISSGLKQASAKLSSANFSQVGKMVDGTAKLQAGVDGLSGGLSQIENGLKNNSSNSQTLSSGIAAIQSSLSSMSGNVKTLSDGYAQMQSGYQQMGESYQGAANALLGVKTALTQMQSMITALGSSYANANSDPNYLGIKQTVNQLLSSLSQITPDGIQTLNENYNATTSGFDTANQGLSQIAAGLSQMADGLTKLKSGIDRSADGIGTIITNMNSVSTGLGQMKSGQQILANGLNGLSTFSGNLSDVNSGLQQISDGLSKTNGFLNELNANKTFFIPNEALTSPDFVKSLDNFMSKDRTITKMIVILNDDPYSAAALNTVKNINTTVSGVLKSSSLNNVQCGVSGPTANTYDLNNILSRDLNRMIIIVLLGILIILILVMRSFWKPVFITLSLVGAYYAASFVTNVIFIDLMHYSGLSSFVPFFAFIIICALGVDYSIFLMMRFKEYPELAPKEAIVTASRHIGGVVTAAVIILGGTFATLIPSGMRILFELAIYVIIGLIVLCFVMLPIFIPAMITLIESVSKISHKQK